jgi:CelD/BcsL family acetyltransferase involved in cellulose biosynthesis
VSGWREFLKLETEWNHLAAQCDDGALLDHAWTAACWKASGALRAREKAIILLLRDGEARLRAVLPLRHNRGTRHLRFLEDIRTQRLNLLAARGAAEAGWALAADALRRRRDWDRCDLNALPASAAAQVAIAFPSAGLDVRLRGRGWQRRLRLESPWPEIEAGFRPELRANCRRRRKRLEAQGSLQLTAVSQPQELHRHLADCLALEQAGWKGAAGTAMLDSPGTTRFYQKLAFRLASRGQLRIFCLRLNQRLIAFEYCCLDPHTRRLYSLKIAYDESLSACSPGSVLRWMLLQHAHAAGFASYEMLGEDARWKADWTSERLELHHLRVYNRTLRGRLWWWRAQARAAAVRRDNG